MKCKQKLCSRSKNIEVSGNCNVCESAISEAVKDFNKNRKNISKKVEVNLELMVKTHEKLSRGHPVDQQVVSNLLLGGVLNILHQHDTIEEMDERIKAVEQITLTDKLRIESLENWTIKQADELNLVKEKVSGLNLNTFHEDTEDSRYLREQIEAIKEEICSMKKPICASASSEDQSKKKSCNECGEKFTRNCQLETHMVNFHGLEKIHACEVCGKTFYLEWRLKKHTSIHTGSHKICKFFQDEKTCPFAEIGCKFIHEPAEKIDDDKEDETEDNLCYYCDTMFGNQEDLIEHMADNHMDRFHHIQQSNSLITF